MRTQLYIKRGQGCDNLTVMFSLVQYDSFFLYDCVQWGSKRIRLNNQGPFGWFAYECYRLGAMMMVSEISKSYTNQDIKGHVLRLSETVKTIRSFEFVIQNGTVKIRIPKHIYVSAFSDVPGPTLFTVGADLSRKYNRDAVFCLESILRINFCKGADGRLYLQGTPPALLRRKADDLLLAFCMIFHPRLGGKWPWYVRELDSLLIRDMMAAEVYDHFLACQFLTRNRLMRD